MLITAVISMYIGRDKRICNTSRDNIHAIAQLSNNVFTHSMIHFLSRLSSTFLLCFAALTTAAQTDTTRHVDIQGEAAVVAWKNHGMLGNTVAGHTQWRLEHLQQLPQILGNANPLRYAQQLPSVQTSNEYDAGLHVQGCASGQNAIMMGECVIYNPNHLLGIFSTFNSGHFSQMDFSTLTSIDKPNRVGGYMRMELPQAVSASYGSERKRYQTELSIGPMSSQGTLHLPFSAKVQLDISARQAYMNLLYGKWLSIDGDEMHYSFADYNATLNVCPNARNILTFSGYWGNDDASFYEGTHLMRTKMKWDNYAAECSLTHHFGNGYRMKQSLFSSGYTSHFALDEESIRMHIRSHIRTHGYRLTIENAHWLWGAEYLLHEVRPQTPQVDNDYYISSTPVKTTTCNEASAYGQYRLKSRDERLLLSVGMRASYFYTNGEEGYFTPSPQAHLTWAIRPSHQLSVHTSMSHQFLHQVGFTSLGLPTEFWFASDKKQKPQHSTNVTLLYDFRPKSRKYSLTAEVYLKHLRNQKEYGDNVLSLFQSDYNLQSVLLEGKGVNYGLGLQLIKHSGRLTGWVSYAFGRSMRQFDGRRKHYPSNYERKQEINLVANYRLTTCINLSLTGVAASGTPYTAAQSFYLINGYIMAQYGEHNAYRLPWYKRIDLSADIALRPHGALKHGINLSLLNALGLNNKLFYRLTTKENKFGYRPIAFLKYPLPSISYHLKF